MLGSEESPQNFLYRAFLFKRGQVEHVLTTVNLKLKPPYLHPALLYPTDPDGQNILRKLLKVPEYNVLPETYLLLLQELFLPFRGVIHICTIFK